MKIVSLRKQLFKLLFLFAILTLTLVKNSFSQTPNIFSDPKLIKEFLDGKTYLIPNYGTITLEFNNSETRRMKEVREKDGADDEVYDLTFNVAIKRNKAKKKDKGDYKIELKIDTNEYLQGEQDPSKKYLNSFTLTRNVLYPIKDFPYNYTLFADGDLYYTEIKYKEVCFNDYKSAIVSGEINPFAFFADFNKRYSTSKYVKCLPVK